MNIGIIGLGSIGQRHARCLQKLGVTNIFALRTKKGTHKELPNDLNHIEEVFNIEEFYNSKLDGVIISNPTSLHIEAMKIPLKLKLPILVEKPISTSLESIDKLNFHDFSKVTVGYCLRYNKLVSLVKGFIDSRKLGQIYKAHLYCGHYLPLWHPYADYRTEYYSRKDLGGGALRTLSHEIDLMHYFFGDVQELYANVEKVSNLEINVDDNVHILNKMKNDAIVHIELDYLNPISERNGIIIGTKGKLEYSFSNKNIFYSDFNGNTEIIYENRDLDPNEMYLNQIHGFLDFIKYQTATLCTFNDGIYVMKVIKASEVSSRTKSWQKII